MSFKCDFKEIRRFDSRFLSNENSHKFLSIDLKVVFSDIFV